MARDFEARGTISYSNFQGGKTNLITSYYFNIYVADSRYALRITAPTKELFDYRDVVYDGTHLFYLSSFESSLSAKRKQWPQITTNHNIAEAYTSKGPVLYHGIAHDTSPIWLALASASYFSSRSNDIIDAVLSFDFAGLVEPEDVRRQKAVWSCQTQFPWLPEEVVYFDDGSRPVEWMRHNKAYSIGYTSAVYKVTQLARFEGIEFPERATLDIYYPQLGGRTNTHLSLAARYDVQVNNVSFAARREIAAPPMPGITYLHDARFSDRAGKVVFAQRTDWPTEAFTTNSSAYNRAVLVKQAPRRKVPDPSRGLVAKVFLLLAFLSFLSLPALLLFRKCFPRSTRKTSTST